MMVKIKTSSKKLLARKATNRMVTKDKKMEQQKMAVKMENKQKQDMMKISQKNRNPKRKR